MEQLKGKSTLHTADELQQLESKELKSLQDEENEEAKRLEVELRSEIREAFGNQQRQSQFDALNLEISRQALDDAKESRLPKLNYRAHLHAQYDIYHRVYHEKKAEVLKLKIEKEAIRIADSLLQALNINNIGIEKALREYIIELIKNDNKYSLKTIFDQLRLKHRDLIASLEKIEMVRVINSYDPNIRAILVSSLILPKKIQRVVDYQIAVAENILRHEAQWMPYLINSVDSSRIQLEEEPKKIKLDSKKETHSLIKKIKGNVSQKLQGCAKILEYKVTLIKQQIQAFEININKDIALEIWPFVWQDAVHAQAQLYKTYDALHPSLDLTHIINELVAIADIASKIVIVNEWNKERPFVMEADALLQHSKDLEDEQFSLAHFNLIENILTKIKDGLAHKKGEKVIQLSNKITELEPLISSEKTKLQNFQNKYRKFQAESFASAVDMLDVSFIINELNSYDKVFKASFKIEIFLEKIRLAKKQPSLDSTFEKEILLDIKILLLSLIDDVLRMQGDSELAGLIKHECRFILQKLEDPLIESDQIATLLEDIATNKTINFLFNYLKQTKQPPFIWRFKAKFHQIFNAKGHKRSDLLAVFGFPNQDNSYNYVEAMFGVATLLTFLKNIFIKVPLDFLPAVFAMLFRQSESLEGMAFYYIFSTIHYITKRVAEPWKYALEEYNQERGFAGGIRAAISLAISTIGIAMIILFFANIIQGSMSVLIGIGNFSVVHSVADGILLLAQQIGIYALSEQILVASVLAIFFTAVLAPLRNAVKALTKKLCVTQTEIETLPPNNPGSKALKKIYERVVLPIDTKFHTDDTDISTPSSCSSKGSNNISRSASAEDSLTDLLSSSPAGKPHEDRAAVFRL